MSEQAKEIFLAILKEVPADQREAYVGEACGDDNTLADRVRDLLRAHEQGGSFLNAPARMLVQAVDEIDQTLDSAGGSSVAEDHLESHVLGDYRISREIGRGGMGVVYEAEQISLGRRVALKVLPFAAVMDQRQLARFKTEAQAAAQLIHQNIVPVHAVGNERGVHYYAMQYVDGQTLAEVIATLRRTSGHVLPVPQPVTEDSRKLAEQLSSGVFSEAELPNEFPATGTCVDPAPRHTPNTLSSAETSPVAGLSTAQTTHGRTYFRSVARLGVQAAEALDHAHTNGVMHRDIKPANLILDMSGKLWVTDFGLARIEGNAGQTMTGDVIGTLRYMSPEQALAKRVVVDHRSDIYSLGSTLYELLTLEPAFSGSDRQELLKQIAFDEPRAPRKINRAVPEDLETIVLKAMSKNPTERYSTAQELADDLERFLEDLPIVARRPTLPHRLSKWSQRHRSLVAAAFFALAVSVIALGVSLYGIAKAHDRALEKHAQAQRQLRIANSLRLTAQARSIRNERPIQSLLLSVEAIEATRRDEGTVLPAARENLQDALRIVGGRPLMVGEHSLNLVLSENGRWMASNSKDEVRLWDLTRPGISQIVLRGQAPSLPVRAVSNDGRWVVSGALRSDRDFEVQLWDLTSRDPLKVLGGHSQLIVNVEISRDGRWLATGSKDATVRLWDLSAEDPSSAVKVLTGPRTGIFTMAISPNSRWLAVGSHEGTARLWDLSEGDPTATSRVFRMSETEPSVRSVAFSPDSQWLATGSGAYGEQSSSVRLWDLNAENPAAAPVVLPGHRWEIDSLQFSPNQQWLVSAAGDGTARIWNLHDADPESTVHVLRIQDMGVSKLAISPDSRWLLTAGRTMRLWSLVADEPSRMSISLHGHDEGIGFAGFTPDSRTLITRSADGAARVWELSDAMPAADSNRTPGGRTYELGASPTVLWRHHSAVTHMESLGTGAKLLAASVDGEVRIWDLSQTNRTTPEVILSGDRMAVDQIAPSQDGRWLAQGNVTGTLHLWDLHQNDSASNVRVLREHSKPVRSVVVSADSRWLATIGSEHATALWDLHQEGDTIEPLILGGRDERLRHLVFSPDARWLAAGGAEHVIRVWDLQAGVKSLVLPGHKAALGFRSLAFSTDSRWLATGSDDRTVRLWDMTAENPAQEPYVLYGHQQPVSALAFSPDARWLAASCATSPTTNHTDVRLWDLADDQFHKKPFLLAEQALIDHGSVFSADGRSLVTCHNDGTVSLWNLTAADPSADPLVLRGHTARVWSVAFSPDGRQLATGGGYRPALGTDTSIRLWDVFHRDGPVPSVVFRGHRSPCSSLMFSSDGHQMITGSNDGTVRVWDLELEKLLELARSTAGRVLTSDERKEFVPESLSANP